MPSSSDRVSRRHVCRRTALLSLLIAGAGCGGRQASSETASAGSDASTSTGSSDTTTRTTGGEPTEPATRTSLVLHDADRDDLPHRSQVGVVSPAVWEWVTTAAETGAVDVGTEERWTPTFPDHETTPTPTSTPAGPASPRVDLAVAAADVLVVDGEPYAVRTVYAGESYAAIEGMPVETIPAPDDDRSRNEIRVATVSELPSEQRRIARAAIENDDGYEVGYHDRRSEAFEAVRAYDYFRYRNRSYRRYLAQGDSFDVHTTLWTEPVDAVDGDDVVFEVENVGLSARGRQVVAAAVADDAGAETVETVPETLVDAVETYDYLATTTKLYRPRLVR